MVMVREMYELGRRASDQGERENKLKKRRARKQTRKVRENDEQGTRVSDHG